MTGKEQEIGAEWAGNDDPQGHPMPLSERIKQLRTEAGLSQAELAQRVGSSDARQISRYEHGRITPSLDAAVRIAEALNVSLDYLAIENVPRRPLHVADHGLAERLAQLSELDDDDRQNLLHMLDALLTRTRLRVLADDGRERRAPRPRSGPPPHKRAHQHPTKTQHTHPLDDAVNAPTPQQQRAQRTNTKDTTKTVTH